MTGSMSLATLKPYTLSIVAALVVIVMVPLVILPGISGLQTSWANLKAKQVTQNQLEAKMKQLEGLNDASNRDALQTKVEPAMPSEADPSGVLGTIEQVAAASGVQPTGVRFANSAAPSAAVSAAAGAPVSSAAVKTNVSVQGGYPNLVNFITQMENVARVIGIDSVHIASGAGNAALVASFNVSAPFQALPTDLGPVEDPLPEMGPAQTAMIDKAAKLTRASYIPTAIQDISGKPSPF